MESLNVVLGAKWKSKIIVSKSGVQKVGKHKKYAQLTYKNYINC